MKIGFIGLGIMGKPMAMNLLKAGHEVVIYRAASEVLAAGAAAASSAAAVARECRYIITMLPNSPHVMTAVTGDEGILEGASPGTVLIDMSSIAPLVSQEIGRACAEKGVRMIDAPVSGGEPKAKDGTLSIMVGGDKAVFDEVKDGILLKMGSSAVYCGELGAGNTAKLANQVVVACNIAACSEAFILAKKAGVEPRLVFEAIRGGLAGSAVMDAKLPMMLAGSYTPGFRVALHIKDLENALQTAHGTGSPLPLTSMVMEMMQWLKSKGFEADDHDALIKYYEHLSGTSLIEN